MKVRRLSLLIAAAILFAVVIATPIYAFTVVEPDGTEHPAIVTDPKTKLDFSMNKYCKLLSTWSKDGKSYEFEDMIYPDFYGGMWLTDDGGLEIAVVDLDEQTKKYFSDIIDITDVTLVKAKYSYSAIYLENKRISELMMNPETEAQRAISSVGIGKNTILLTFNCGSIAAAEEYAKSITSFDVWIEAGMVTEAEPIITVEDPVESNIIYEEL